MNKKINSRRNLFNNQFTRIGSFIVFMNTFCNMCITFGHMRTS